MALISLRPFLDTNVIFSGLYSPFGAPAAILSASDCLVTGNSRHFTPEVERCVGFRILSPAAYLAELEASR